MQTYTYTITVTAPSRATADETVEAMLWTDLHADVSIGVEFSGEYTETWAMFNDATRTAQIIEDGSVVYIQMHGTKGRERYGTLDAARRALGASGYVRQS